MHIKDENTMWATMNKDKFKVPQIIKDVIKDTDIYPMPTYHIKQTMRALYNILQTLITGE